MLDQHWAKTKLAPACVRNVNYLSLNLLKLFLSHMLWPRTSMSICSCKLGSQGESSKETTNISMCCSRWCHLCHRFQSLQDYCCCFLFKKSKTEQRAMAGTTTKNAVFFEVRASWIILGCFRIQSGHLIFTFRFWYLLTVFGSWVFWSLFLSMAGASPWPNPTEDAPYLNAENNIMEASPEELASCSLAFTKWPWRG